MAWTEKGYGNAVMDRGFNPRPSM